MNRMPLYSRNVLATFRSLMESFLQDVTKNNGLFALPITEYKEMDAAPIYIGKKIKFRSSRTPSRKEKGKKEITLISKHYQ